MSTVELIISDLPPSDGREWNAQCARCGSSVAIFTPPRECLSSAAWCEAHPLEGRELTKRGELEWFTFDPVLDNTLLDSDTSDPCGNYDAAAEDEAE